MPTDGALPLANLTKARVIAVSHRPDYSCHYLRLFVNPFYLYEQLTVGG